jgi:pimeloyl-ACP methyl ester carboxylesterase
MDLPIRFCTTADGVRIAYATLGQGPALVFPPGTVTHLEVFWESSAVRAFYERLAQHHTVVLIDRWGCGLSDRQRTDFSLESEVRTLEAVIEQLTLQRFALCGISTGGPIAIAYISKHPGRVTQLVLYGSFADGARLAPDDVKASFLAFMRSAWGLGSKVLVDLMVPDADPETRAWFAHAQRTSASAEMAAALMETNYRYTVTDLLPTLRLPTVVIHRRGKRAVRLNLARELAAGIPDAQFVVLDGTNNMPWFEDAESVLRAIAAFFGDPEPVGDDAAARDAPTEERRLTTVLFTDIVGSTEHAARLGDRRWRELKERHHALVRRELARFRGREVDTAGDGFFAAFDGPARAVRCAQAIGQAVQQLGLDLRAGLHTGEVERHEGSLTGIAVHIGPVWRRSQGRAKCSCPARSKTSSPARDSPLRTGARTRSKGFRASGGSSLYRTMPSRRLPHNVT